MRYILILLVILLGANSSAQLPPYILSNGLLGFYGFNENLEDNSGNGHNGVLVGNIDYEWTSGYLTSNVPYALFGNGTLVNCGDVDAFENTDTLSAYASIYCFDLGGAQESEQIPILSKWSSVNDPAESSFKFFMNGTHLVAAFSDGYTMDSVSVEKASTYVELWLPLILGFTFENGVARIFVYEEEVARDTLSITSINNSATNFKIGGWKSDLNPSYENYTGYLDEVMLYNRVLHPCEMFHNNSYGMPFVQIWFSQGVLSSPYSSGQFQWLDCNNNYNPISGATASNYTPTVNGSYCLRMERLGCVDTSVCITINNLGLDEYEFESFTVYPNPAHTYIQAETEKVNLLWNLHDLYGKILMSGKIEEENKRIDISELKPGVYFLKCDAGIARVIKE